MKRKARDDKVELQHTHALLGAQVPDPHRLIERPRCQYVTIAWVELDCPRCTPMPAQRAAQRPRSTAENLDRVISVCACKEHTIGAES